MSLDEAALVADVRARLFAHSSSALTIGAEVELIPVVAATKAPAPILSSAGSSSVEMIRWAGRGRGWDETPSASGAPSWSLPDGSRLSFEPGGQIEISSRPHQSCSSLVTSLQETVSLLTASADENGMELLSVGVDPFNDIDAVPLQLDGDRYVMMTHYLNARGESGIRMMRQTAALQISVEHGPKPNERWALLNALAPYIVAIFANSSRYAGCDTGHASYRAHLWRKLDRSRTGIPFDKDDPALRYAEFALDAGALRGDRRRGEFKAFRWMLADSELRPEDWQFHLSTLFPEIRPKEYFEIRSADTIGAGDLIAPLAFVAGLVYDERSAIAALDVLGAPDEDLLRCAGQEGLGNAKIKSRAAQLVHLSAEGALRLPTDYITPRHRTQAAAWLAWRMG